jgi:hypothetical protein
VPSPARTAIPQRHAGTLGLDARLRRIGEETRRLESDYRALVARCASGAEGTGSGGDEWLLTLLAARLRGPVDSGGAVPASCDTGWNDLVARTGALKADLDGAERLARAAGLPSRDWQGALGAHGLERWYEY